MQEGPAGSWAAEAGTGSRSVAQHSSMRCPAPTGGHLLLHFIALTSKSLSSGSAVAAALASAAAPPASSPSSSSSSCKARRGLSQHLMRHPRVLQLHASWAHALAGAQRTGGAPLTLRLASMLGRTRRHPGAPRRYRSPHLATQCQRRVPLRSLGAPTAQPQLQAPRRRPPRGAQAVAGAARRCRRRRRRRGCPCVQRCRAAARHLRWPPAVRGGAQVVTQGAMIAKPVPSCNTGKL